MHGAAAVVLVMKARERPEICGSVQTGGGRKPAGRDGSVLSHRQQRPKVEGTQIVSTVGGSAAHGLQLKLRKSPLRPGAGMGD